MNRQVTDRICTYYFAPTEQSRANLLQENIDAKKIFITGNTVIDALLMAVDIISTTAGVKEKMAKELLALSDAQMAMLIERGRFSEVEDGEEV